MKKLTSIILAALLSATALCACSQGTQSVPDITETQEETEAELTTVEETTEAEPTTETVTEAAPLTEEELAPADILTYTVEVNGKTLSIPFDYDELVELGFSLKEDDELKAQSYTIGVYPEKTDFIVNGHIMRDCESFRFVVGLHEEFFAFIVATHDFKQVIFHFLFPLSFFSNIIIL